jgi:hypothetical protein
MKPERQHLLMIIALQSALCSDGHTDPAEAYGWAARQGLVSPHVMPEDLMQVKITPRGREYIHAWSERQMDVMLEDWLGPHE